MNKGDSYTSPWTLRAYEALPGNPVTTGIGVTVVLLLLFLIGRPLAGTSNIGNPDEFRVAITQILITTYSSTAYAYLLMSVRRTMLGLSTVASGLPDWQTSDDRAGKYPWWVLPLVGLLSFLIIGVAVTNATTPEPVNPWDWQGWNYDVFWHRLTTVFLVWWMSCFCYVIVVESARLSRLSEKIDSLDLFDLQAFRPLVRQGLTNALLVIGMASVLSLLGVEARYLPVLLGFWILCIFLAWIGMMLPLRGIRRNIRTAKTRELQWCGERLRQARDALKSGSEVQPSISEVTAYQTMIENIRNWPFDSSTLVRFTLYLLIPLGSWLGGAFVERALDLILS